NQRRGFAQMHRSLALAKAAMSVKPRPEDHRGGRREERRPDSECEQMVEAVRARKLDGKDTAKRSRYRREAQPEGDVSSNCAAPEVNETAHWLHEERCDEVAAHGGQGLHLEEKDEHRRHEGATAHTCEADHEAAHEAGGDESGIEVHAGIPT